METSFTPGPWIWRWKSGSLHRAGTDGYTYGDTVLQPTYDYDSGVGIEISDADDQLIAAAPEMLAALIALVAADGGDDPEIVAARAAIAKATGETT